MARDPLKATDEELASMVGAEADAFGDDDDDESSVEDVKNEPAEEASEPAEEASAAAEPETAAAEEAAPAPEIGQPEVARAAVYMQVPDITGLQDKAKELTESRAEVRRLHSEGEIDRDEYERRLDEVNDKQRELDRIQVRYETAMDYNRRLDLSIYMGRIEAQKKAAIDDGIDYDKSPVLMAAWDSRVKALAKDEAWIKKGDAAILAQAHQDVVESIRGTAEKLGLTAQKSGDPRTMRDAVGSRKPDTKGVKTLAKAPAAGATDPRNSDEFAAIDELDGMEREAALAALSPEKAARYLNG